MIPGTSLLLALKKILVQKQKRLSVFFSSDDQLEDSDSDEHSRSDSVTGANSWTTS